MSKNSINYPFLTSAGKLRAGLLLLLFSLISIMTLFGRYCYRYFLIGPANCY